MTNKKEETCVVRFIARNRMYNAGDRASFPLAYAKRLIDGKKAVLDDKATESARLDTVAAEELAVNSGIDSRTHDLNIGEVTNLVADIEDEDELIKLAEGERNHPRHPGGRKGVHEAIKDRVEELEDE